MAPATTATTSTRMPHRFLGKSGLLVSKLSLGSWMFEDDKNCTADNWYEMMKVAFKHGVNCFDNAEAYGCGLAERNMGAAIKKGVADGIWAREDLVVITKVFFGSKGWFEGGPNDQGLSRKHIVEGTKASLARLQLDYVDVIFCHRPEPFTPIEETVRAMNFVIDQGLAFYWGTSSWSSAQILEACDIADRLGLARPIVEQPEYNLMERRKVEIEYEPLYAKYGLGLTTWSPLSFGVLSGKYASGAPDGSRMSNTGLKAAMPDFEERVAKAETLKPIAKELGVTLAQLAIAWCLSNDQVSTVIVGASRPSQLEENIKALDVVEKLTPELKKRIEALVPLQAEQTRPDTLPSVRARHL
ncbi:Voltage-gated potassium channel subunit beta-2 [Phytophthora boehmeriae]|uniref:Voltage-gated potassium channel subunit beta-2 n=1 Tax=Phytophthora boehmeriae TaxID=109152 RepID=A0A8T1X260_9STRA|nr:Voltage-gated potassium channel subunit beta-2 [Phytophthora boehmeriae]